MLDEILIKIKKLIPKDFFEKVQPIYHYLMSLAGALFYFFPSRKIFVLGITGTKGKTSTAEIVSAILEEAGYKTAIASTLRFKVDQESEDNKRKMTMPGRFFIQRLLRRAVNKKCDYAIIEMTSEGTKQFRHKFIALNALIFTNLAKEHIESHGSYEKYLEAKLKIANVLEKSKKEKRIIIANQDDKQSPRFLNINVNQKFPYSLSQAEPFTLEKNGMEITVDNTKIKSYLSGEFNIYNILAAITFAKSQSIGLETIKEALEKFRGIRGRMEEVNEGQDFTVIVDYAHTPDSLEKVYQFIQNHNKICVLGGTGGGRDRWKRKEMGSIADKYCQKIILTNEDPYDEDPLAILEDIKKGIERPIHETILDRREAIKKAISSASTGDVVIITGKGTDPYIMGPNGSRLEWDDANVVREELKK